MDCVRHVGEDRDLGFGCTGMDVPSYAVHVLLDSPLHPLLIPYTPGNGSRGQANGVALNYFMPCTKPAPYIAISNNFHDTILYPRFHSCMKQKVMILHYHRFPVIRDSKLRKNLHAARHGFYIICRIIVRRKRQEIARYHFIRQKQCIHHTESKQNNASEIGLFRRALSRQERRRIIPHRTNHGPCSYRSKISTPLARLKKNEVGAGGYSGNKCAFGEMPRDAGFNPPT